MPEKPCRLFDEHIVYCIMRATGNSVIEYLRENGIAGPDEVTDFVEGSFDEIISGTIRELSTLQDCADEECTGEDQALNEGEG